MKKIILLALAFFAVSLAMGTHLRCGYIVAERSDCTSKTVTITINVFTNTTSEVRFGEDGILYFGDGTSIVVPRVENTPRPDLGPNIGMASYTVNHIYGSLANYLISYVEPNRNGGVLNMEDSFNTTFYTETRINLTTPKGCSVPIFLVPSLFSGFTGSEISMSLGAASPDDNQITYHMAVPYRDLGLPVVGYWEPENMELNYLTGLLTWNTESAAPGEYNFAVVAVQSAKQDEVIVQLGFTRIDFQVILSGEPPETLRIHDNQELDEYSRILVPDGETKTVRVFYEVDNTYTPTLEIFSELIGSAVTFTAYDSVSPPSGKKIKVGVLTITPAAEDVRENGYQIVVRGKAQLQFQLQSHVSDISYLIYTDGLPALPEIITSTEDDIVDIQIFPNPVQSQITIHVNKEGASEVRLYSTQGSLIKTKGFEDNTTLILSELPAGIYICDVRKNNISIRKIKLIKQ